MKHFMAIGANHSDISYLSLDFSTGDWHSMMGFDEIVTYLTIFQTEIKPADLAVKTTMLLLEFILCSLDKCLIPLSSFVLPLYFSPFGEFTIISVINKHIILSLS